MPIGNGVRRYSPCASVTAVTDGTCSAGLVAVTVTPGRIAPVPSVICPMMPAADALPPWPAVAIVAAGSRLMRMKRDDERGGSCSRVDGSGTTSALLFVLLPNRSTLSDL